MVNSKAMDCHKIIRQGPVAHQDHGKRLDAALAALFPDLGLRARRRLWEWCAVLLDGKPAGPGEQVKAGQLIAVNPLQEHANQPIGEGIRIVAARNGFIAISKPKGVASARLSGGKGSSAEEFVQADWERLSGEWNGVRAALGEEAAESLDLCMPELKRDAPLLCNRLDTATSGLLLWAEDAERLAVFKKLEAAGQVDKFYYAIVEGRAPQELYIDRALNMARREKTLVLDQPDLDATRHTSAWLLEEIPVENGVNSLLNVLIRRGARHQIRAHLAWAGFPILGDSLYGSGLEPAGRLYLHHYRIEFKGFSAELEPE